MFLNLFQDSSAMVCGRVGFHSTQTCGCPFDKERGQRERTKCGLLLVLVYIFISVLAPCDRSIVAAAFHRIPKFNLLPPQTPSQPKQLHFRNTLALSAAAARRLSLGVIWHLCNQHSLALLLFHTVHSLPWALLVLTRRIRELKGGNRFYRIISPQ